MVVHIVYTVIQCDRILYSVYTMCVCITQDLQVSKQKTIVNLITFEGVQKKHGNSWSSNQLLFRQL